MAGVLVSDVDVLLFDEPLANLDPATGKRTIELIDRLNKERNITKCRRKAVTALFRGIKKPQLSL